MADLSSAQNLTSSQTDGLPESSIRRLAALLDTSDAWRTLAELLELDVNAVEQHGSDSPTRYILHCVGKYASLSLALMAAMLESLGQTEAAGIVREDMDK